MQGVLTAAQAASKVPPGNILFTLVMYLSLYAVLLTAYVSVVFHLAKKASVIGDVPETLGVANAKPRGKLNIGGLGHA